MSYVPKKPRPGEIFFKQWMFEEARRQGVSDKAIWHRFNRGHYPDLKVRRETSRTFFVLATSLCGPVPKHKPRKGEVRLTDWATAEARRLYYTFSAVLNRFYRGEYRGKLTVRRVNSAVVFVKVKQ